MTPAASTGDMRSDGRPVWTPNGKSVLFGRTSGASLYSGDLDIFRQAADGTGTPEALTQHSGGGLPWSMSPDRTLLYEKLPNPSDVRMLSLDRLGESRPVLADPKFDEWGAALSWDGRWLAYSSNESGRHEIYVRPFPNVNSGRWQISSGGDSWPRWSRSGQELFFVKTGAAAASSGRGDLMAVPIQAGTTFTFGGPQKLPSSASYGNVFDVDLDAKRFLRLKSVGADASARPSIVVVAHWLEEVRARMGR